jgi:hypothetical protein
VDVDSVTPGRKWYIIAALMILAGVFLIPAAIVIPLLSAPKPVPFIVPGSHPFNLTTPGEFVLWHNYDTIFEGKTFSSNALPGGLQMQLSNITARTVVPLVPNQSTTVSSRSDARRSVATFTVTNSGQYLLSVQGAAPEMVFSFGKAMFANMAAGVIATIVLAPTLLISGLAIGVWALITRQRRIASLRLGQAVSR